MHKGGERRDCWWRPVFRLLGSSSRLLTFIQLGTPELLPSSRKDQYSQDPSGTGVAGGRGVLAAKLQMLWGCWRCQRPQLGLWFHVQVEHCKEIYLKPGEVLRWGLSFSFQTLPLLAELSVVQPRAAGWGPVIFNYMFDQSVFHAVLK